jgi:DNA-binding response OmpR family regulator
MKILIIEDEAKIADSLKQGLEQEHYVVDTAYNGTEGYDLAIAENYDLIILDRMLPGMDGLTICENLRKEQNSTPILMLTAKGQLYDKVAGLNSGADDYLTKPFAFEELLARVKALTRRPKVTTESILKIADLTLNTTSYEIKRGGKVIPLSSKEFALLEYLLRNKNKTVTKEQIINDVWHYDANILPNTVEVYIRYLRNKIDKPFDTPLIHTVRGFGYRLGSSY